MAKATVSVKVNDKVWKELRLLVKGIAKRRVRVGVIGNGDLAEIAAIHEFGAPAANIPERSFIRFTFKNRRGDLDKMCERLARGLLAQKLGVDQALGMLGAWSVAAIQRSITDKLIKQDLQPSTIAARKRKGSSKIVALLDTGALKNAITWAIDAL